MFIYDTTNEKSILVKTTSKKYPMVIWYFICNTKIKKYIVYYCTTTLTFEIYGYSLIIPQIKNVFKLKIVTWDKRI